MLIVFVLLPVNTFLKAETSMSDAQAMFIYNFIRYVNWPQHPIQDRYVIGVVGSTPVYTSLEKYTKDRLVGGKSVQVTFCNRDEDMQKCHILYISQSQRKSLEGITKKLQGTSCLTVFDNCSRTRYSSSAIIDLVMVDRSLKFRLNVPYASNQNLIISNVLVNMSI